MFRSAYLWYFIVAATAPPPSPPPQQEEQEQEKHHHHHHQLLLHLVLLLLSNCTYFQFSYQKIYYSTSPLTGIWKLNDHKRPKQIMEEMQKGLYKLVTQIEKQLN